MSGLFVIGFTGRVGQALLARLRRLGGPGLLGVANTGGAWWFPNPVAPARLDEAVLETSLQRLDGTLERLRQHAGGAVVLDVTASAEVAQLYPRLLSRGIAVVAANKEGFAGSQAAFDLNQRLAQVHGTRLGYETTVGAALPLLGTLARHRAVGDRLLSLDATLSGTLAYVLDQVHAGVGFSAAVQAAERLGYTEPDPNHDLGGLDVLRKLVILLRQAGLSIEPAAIHHRPLIDRPWRGPDPELDRHWRERVAQARAAGGRWVYLARYQDDHAGVEPRLLPADHPLAQSRGTDNVIVIRTELYRDPPLVIRGPGAGPELTAAGVLQDALEALAKRAADGSWPRLRAVG